MEKKCLIIDNEDQSAEIEKLTRDAEKKGLIIEVDQFNVGSTANVEMLTNGKIDIGKVIECYWKRFKGQTFQLAAIDWDLNDDDVDGIELLRQFKAKRILRNTPLLLYTGLLEERLPTKLNQFKEGKISDLQLYNHINYLIKAGIKDFVRREEYEQHILRLLSTTDETIDLIIEEQLNNFPDLKFAHGFTNKAFNGKTFSQLSAILENEDGMRNDFKKEIIQQVIAYLTEKIGDA